MLGVDLLLVDPSVGRIPPVRDAGVHVDVQILGALERRLSAEPAEIGVLAKCAAHVYRAAFRLGPGELREPEVLTELARGLAGERPQLTDERRGSEQRVAA